MENVKKVLNALFSLNESLNEEGNTLSFSVDIGAGDELDSKYDTLYNLEHFINSQGGSLMMQDDSDYFGGQIDFD